MTADADRTPEEVRAWLTDIADMAADVPDPGMITGPKDSQSARPVPSSKPPTRLDVLSLLTRAERYDALWEHGMEYVDPDGAGILPYLWGWVRDIEATLYEESPALPDEAPQTPTVANCAGWLAKHADASAGLREWPELVYGLRNLRENLRRATASVRGVDRKPVPCSRCGEPLERLGDKAEWWCDNGHQVTVHAVTLRQAATITGTPLRTLQAWAKRNLFTRLRESERVNLYDLNDIRRVVAEVKLRGA